MPLGLRYGCRVAVVAGRRWRQRALRRCTRIGSEQRTCRQRSVSKHGTSRRRIDHQPLSPLTIADSMGSDDGQICRRLAYQPIVSSSSIIPAITDSPPSQNAGSLASSRTASATRHNAWCRRPRASRVTLGKSVGAFS